jgi:hypothetical protein
VAQLTTQVTDAMRAAPVFTAYALDIHLQPAQASIAVLAHLELRNGGATPLAILPLQLSSTLRVERVSLNGTTLPFADQTISSDADHTGQLSESAVQLPQPLASGATLSLTVEYSGTVEPSTARLDRIGTPADVANRSDWDRISDDFTGLRGFGDVVWYPVSSVPALLGDGARLFAEIGRQRLRNQEATVSLDITDEFTGSAPDIGVLSGHVVDPGPPRAEPTASFPGVARITLPATRLGFRTPTLFLAHRVAGSENTQLVRVYSTPAHQPDAQGYSIAAGLVEPLLTSWLGTRGRNPLAILDLPIDGAQPSEQGDAVLTSLVAAEPPQIAPLLSQELAHASFHSPRAWLNEGVPELIATLYTEQIQGRDKALERLASSRAALALVEPSSPGEGSGQTLLVPRDAIYYRAKAADVLWMLRDLAGDKPLSAALRAYDPGADLKPEYFEKLLEEASGQDLKWFFKSWVYQDLGLPDLSIVNVYPSRSSQADQWLTSVEIANEGYADTEVPVTLHSSQTAVTERIRIPARSHVNRRILITGEPTSVDVNDGTVPEVQASVHQRQLASTPSH